MLAVPVPPTASLYTALTFKKIIIFLALMVAINSQDKKPTVFASP